MSAQQHIARTFASLWVTSEDLPHEAMSQWIGLGPDRTGVRGEPRWSESRFIHPHHLWSWTTDERLDAPALSAHLELLLQTLEAHADALTAEEFTSQTKRLVAVYAATEQDRQEATLELPAAILERIRALRLDLYLDLYFC